MILQLKQYDTELLTFDFTETELEGEKISIISINHSAEKLLPLDLIVSEQGLLYWLKKRIIPKNRYNADTILSRSGLSINDTLGITKLCKGFSLNDSYWVTEKDFKGKFKDYNLYQNKFNTTLASIAFTGYGSLTAKGFSSSPEYTTNGMLKKAWRIIGGKTYLYKGGTSGASNTGLEPYSEYYASQIATRMGLNHIDYNLSKWKGSLCSTCELFTDINTSYIPIGRLVSDGGLLGVSRYLKSLGDNFYEDFCDMIIFDCLICNTDRHYGNFGILVDNKTNMPIKFAPIFDNGLSLFNYATDDDLDNLYEYAKTRIPANAKTFMGSAKEFMGKRQKEKLRKMIGFKFTKHPTYNLPSKRLKKIEKFLQTRVSLMLDI